MTWCNLTDLSLEVHWRRDCAVLSLQHNPHHIIVIVFQIRSETEKKLSLLMEINDRRCGEIMLTALTPAQSKNKTAAISKIDWYVFEFIKPAAANAFTVCASCGSRRKLKMDDIFLKAQQQGVSICVSAMFFCAPRVHDSWNEKHLKQLRVAVLYFHNILLHCIATTQSASVVHLTSFEILSLAQTPMYL